MAVTGNIVSVICEATQARSPDRQLPVANQQELAASDAIERQVHAARASAQFVSAHGR
jgi:hypothetical protein